MSNFDRRTAIRIALVSVAMAFLAGPIAWFLALERAEESVVALANEESGRLLHRFDSINLSGLQAEEHAQAAAYAIAGGLFDIAEIYDAKGRKLAESLTVQLQNPGGAALVMGRPTTKAPPTKASNPGLTSGSCVCLFHCVIRQPTSRRRLPATLKG